MRTHDNEPFVLRRDVKAVMVPAGIELELKSGQSGFITQALGGSFTLYMEGNLFRIAGADADAIGKDVVKTPELPPDSTEDVAAGPSREARSPKSPPSEKGAEDEGRVNQS